jgi:ATP-dependent DNA ligase
MSDETVLDGEVVALDEEGRPSSNALQSGSATAQPCYYVFDMMAPAGRKQFPSNTYPGTKESS